MTVLNIDKSISMNHAVMDRTTVFLLSISIIKYVP